MTENSVHENPGAKFSEFVPMSSKLKNTGSRTNLALNGNNGGQASEFKIGKISKYQIKASQ
jgi:hypothetical protein